MKITLGRNDLCHCGSGKKYKKCHLKIDQEKARQLRNLETPKQWLDYCWQRVSEQIETLVAEQVDLVAQRWGTRLAVGPYLSLIREHILLDVGQQKEHLTRLVKEDEKPLSETQSELVDALIQSRLTCYQVTACRRGEYLVLEDKISGSLHTIRDDELSHQLEPMEAFCGRVVSVGDTGLVLPGWLKLKFWDREKVFQSVRTQYETMGANLDDIEEMQILLKRRPELIVTALEEAQALANPQIESA